MNKKQNIQTQKNFAAFLARTSMSVKKHLNTELRIPVLKRSCELLRRFDDYLQEQAINKCAEEFNLSRKLLKGFLSDDDKPVLSKADELREKLLTFDIRQNEITGEISIEKNKKEYTVEELKLILDNEDYDLKHFDKYLNADNKNITVTKLYNPLQDFFKELANNYKGEKLISELASCIPAMNFGDREEGFYRKRLEYYLKKWLYKSAGQALGIGKNDAMLLWIEPLGGSGKSYINRWLFSLPEFENYYMRIGENASFIDMQSISKGKFAIDWDELPLSQKRYQMFKSYIAAEGGQAYNKRKKKYENYTRQVNYIGSTNKANRERQPGFLLDDDDAMKRRIIPIELDGRINYQKYTQEIDLYQLWAEAAAGILQAQKANNQQLLSYECDWKDLRAQNSRYVNMKNIDDKNAILELFKPSDKANGKLVSPSDMLQELKAKGLKTNLNEISLGFFLKKHYYEKGRIGNYRGYWVKK
jgi:predicted P-loop ATPase